MKVNRIKYDISLMKFISLFEAITQAKLKDAVDEESRLLFVVEEGEIGKAIGKNGMNVKRLENVLNKRIRIVEFNNDLLQFVRNLIYPLAAREIKEENKIVIIAGNDAKTKGLLIGRDAQNLRAYENVVKRYFEIEGIKVV